MQPATSSDGSSRVPRSVRALRWILYGLLLLSATLTLAGLPELQREVAAGRWPRAALALPAVLLGLFIVGYAAYRFTLVRAGRYPAGKALVQVGLMLLVLGVVGSVILDRARPAPGPTKRVDFTRMLASPDPEARAMAAELLRHRPRDVATPHVERLCQLVEDPAADVRREAHATLVQLAGKDAGGEGAGAGDRWRDYWREYGFVP